VIDILHDGKEATKPIQRRDRIGVAIRDIDKMVRHLVNVAHPVPESSRCLPHIRTFARAHRFPPARSSTGQIACLGVPW
jgi:hypothetical protein